MASVKPDPAAIHAFKTEALFERWLAVNHAKRPEIYLRIYKRGSDVPTVTYAQAIDVAMCWGWIDGIKKPYDSTSFLQRFTPRKAKSVWSKINRGHIERLIKAGRITEHGMKAVEAAKADGRWEAAYAGSKTMEMPVDLVSAIEADPAALKTFRSLNKANLYALAYRVGSLKTPAGRAKRIEAFVEMLKRGETLHPNGAANRTTKKS